MTDEELLKLSAYFDGEGAGAEHREIDAALPGDGARRAALAAFAALRDAAAVESVPQPFRDGDAVAAGVKCWPSIVNDISALQIRTEESAEPLHRAAAFEEAPQIKADRFEKVWHGVADGRLSGAASGSGLRSAVSREAAPRVDTGRWKGVWNEISQRTSRTPNRTMSAKPTRFSSWIWAAGIGLAASVFLAISFPPSAQDERAPNDAAWRDGRDGTDLIGAPAVSMNVPEVQGDDYGVRVRFLPGSVDPVISLYFKSPHREKATNSSATDEQ